MKSLCISCALALAIVLSLNSRCHSQTHDTVSAQVPYSVFPIGAMGQGDVESWLGDNFSWIFWYDYISPSWPMEIGPRGFTLKYHQDPFYYDTTGTGQTVSRAFGYIDDQHDNAELYIAEAARAHDVRVFLPGTSGDSREYYSRWNQHQVGTIAVDQGRPLEWLINPDSSLSGDYVLEGLEDRALTNVYYPTGHSETFDDNTYGTSSGFSGSHVGPYRYDFVFWIQNPNGAIDTNTPLYTLEYWVKEDGDTLFNVKKVDTITYAKYNRLPIAKTTLSGQSSRGEDLSTWYLDNINGTRTRQTIPYRMLSDTLPVWQYYHGNFAGSSNRVKIDVRLKTFKKWPIYPRCLRIRDWRAQVLFSGRADDSLKAELQSLKLVAHNADAKAWALIDEPDIACMRAWVYVNELMVKASVPPAKSQVTGDFDVFARIAKNQSDIPVDHAWHDAWYFAGGPGRIAFIDKHSTPHKPRFSYWDWPWSGWDWSIWDWQYKTPQIPLPSAAAVDSAYEYRHGVGVISDHDRYTRIWQDSLIGHGSESLNGGYGHDRSELEYARSCYEYDPDHIQPYLIVTQNMVTPRQLGNEYAYLPKWEIDSLYLSRADSIGQLLVDSLYARRTASDSLLAKGDFPLSEGKSRLHPWIVELYDSLVVQYARQPHPLLYDSLYDLAWQNRAPTASELRYQLWSGVIHGVKGYMQSYAGDDGLEQLGLLYDSIDPIGIHHLLRTQDRPVITYRPYWLANPYDLSHKWLAPWLYIVPEPTYAHMFETSKELNLSVGAIGMTLAPLQWRGTVSWHMKDSTPTYLSRLPVQNVRTASKAGSFDSTAYTDFGIHRDPKDSLAIYVSLLNRRLWIDSTGTDSTDFRNVSFKVKPSAFNPLYSTWPVWEVTDVASGVKRTLSTDDEYTVPLLAGEGRLLKIAPYLTTPLGRIATNRYNNARHIACNDTTGLNPPNAYYLTYEDRGNIKVAYPQERTEGAVRRTAGTPVDTVIESNGYSHNPAIAMGRDIPTGLGLVYSVDRVGASKDSTYILFRNASLLSPYAYSSPDTLDRFRVTDTTFVATPAIAVAKFNDGDYWISWRHPLHGAAIAFENKLGRHYPVHYFSAGDSATTKFISIASNLTLSARTARDSCYIAMEEHGDIHFVKAWIDPLGGDTTIATTTPKNISISLGCGNRMPCIAVNSDGHASVTWESDYSFLIHPGVCTSGNRHFVVVKERGKNGVWSNFTLFHVKDVCGASDSLILLPTNGLSVFSSGVGHAPEMVAWNDNTDKHIRVSQLTGHYWGEPGKFIEPSLEPSQAVTNRGFIGLAEAMSFRSPGITPDRQRE